MTISTKLRASGRNQLVRPRFSPGLMLEDTDLTQGVDYVRELNRLMFRSLLGCGVVCGLKVTLHDSCCIPEIRIAPGLALTGCGDPIHVPAQQVIVLDPSLGGVPNKLWVVLSRREYACMPRESGCSVDEDPGDTVRTRLADGFEIRLIGHEASRKGACGCAEPVPGQSDEDAEKARLACYQHRADGECECDCASDVVILGLFEDIEAAKATPQAKTGQGKQADHRVRRFVGPELMRDPLLKAESTTLASPAEDAAAAANDAEKAVAAARVRSAEADDKLEQAVAFARTIGGANPAIQAALTRLEAAKLQAAQTSGAALTAATETAAATAQLKNAIEAS